ncbi:MAG: histone deacetylase family protein [Caldilineaceae bacterium]
MLTIYSEKHRHHNPPYEFLERGIVPYTEAPARAETIVSALAAAGIGPIAPPDDFGLAPIRAVHADDYLDHLQTIYADWVAVGGTAQAAMPFAFPRADLNGDAATPYARVGRYAFDMSAPITATSWDAILASAQCALTAAQRVLDGEPVTYALCRPPGHHASQNLMGGYCFLNNAAIAAEFLTRGRRQRVAIVDVDVHHGNGTQRIFYDRGDVLFVSIHGDPQWEYPYFLGNAHERGDGAGAGATLNFPLEKGIDNARYLAVLGEALDAVRRFTPDALVVSAGFDTFGGDPLGQFKLTTDAYREMGRRFAVLGLPTVLVQEGGYAVHALGENVVNLLQGFAETPA